MSWRTRLAGWIAGRGAAPQAPYLEPPMSDRFGPGIGNQPNTDTLLRELRGVAHASTRAIADRLSSLMPVVKERRRGPDGRLEETILAEHPLQDLFEKPHPNFTWRLLVRTAGFHMLSVGNAYWLKVRNRGQLVSQLHPIPPTMIEPLVLRGITRGYLITDARGNQTPYPADQIIRVQLPDPENPWGGEGYLGPMGIEADTQKFSGQHLRSHFQHDATPKSVLEAATGAEGFSPEELERFYALWKQWHHTRGGEKQGLPGVLPIHYKLVQMAQQTGKDITPFLEYLREELLMGFNTPRAILGQVVSGDRSSAETLQFVFDKHAVSPLAHILSDALTLQLASEFEVPDRRRRNSRIVVGFDEFISRDKEFELKMDESDLRMKVRSPKQVVRDRGRDPSTTTWGDFPVGTLNDTPYTGEQIERTAVGGGKIEDDDEPTEEEERKIHIAVRRMFRERRLLRAQQEQLEGS